MFSALKHPVTNPGPLVLWPIPLNNSCILWAWGQNSPCLRLVFRKQVIVGVEAWYQRLWQQAQRAPKIHRTHYISFICTNLAELASTRLSKICPTSELKYPSTRIKVSSTSLLGGSVSQDGREQFHIFFWVVFSGIYIFFLFVVANPKSYSQIIYTENDSVTLFLFVKSFIYYHWDACKRHG